MHPWFPFTFKTKPVLLRLKFQALHHLLSVYLSSLFSHPKSLPHHCGCHIRLSLNFSPIHILSSQHPFAPIVLCPSLLCTPIPDLAWRAPHLSSWQCQKAPPLRSFLWYCLPHFKPNCWGTPSWLLPCPTFSTVSSSSASSKLDWSLRQRVNQPYPACLHVQRGYIVYHEFLVAILIFKIVW